MTDNNNQRKLVFATHVKHDIKAGSDICVFMSNGKHEIGIQPPIELLGDAPLFKIDK